MFIASIKATTIRLTTRALILFVISALGTGGESRLSAEEIGLRMVPMGTDRLDRSVIAASIEELAGRRLAKHAVAHLESPPTESDRQRLRKAGVMLLRSLNRTTYFVSLTPGTVNVTELVNVEGLLSLHAVESSWKQDPRILAGTTPDFVIVAEPAPGLRIVALYVLFHPDVALDVAASAVVERHGATLRGRLRSINGLVIELPETHIAALASDDTVQWIEFPLPRMSSVNNGAGQLSEAALIQSPPYSLTGAGVTAMVYDAGTVRDTHVDFQGRLVTLDAAGLSNHATHVAGTLGGAGIGDPIYKGMAPSVSMLSYGLEFDDPYIFLYSNPADLESDYDEAFNVFGADLANNSIGSNIESNVFECEVQGNYGVTSALIDAIVNGSLGMSSIVIWAAGNERQGDRCDVEGFGDYYSTAPPAGAKNHISVGAVNSNNDTMTTFSAWGPLDDGRLKPDLVAPGCQVGGDGGVTSCGSTHDTAYATRCGTSMAAPTVSGIVALLLEDFREQYVGTPDPINSTIKAILIHNAQDILNVGPDYKSGYGSVRARRAVDFLRTGQFFEGIVAQGDTVAVLVPVDPDTTELKITAVWDDMPGTPNVNPALVNDLDLRVFDAAGQRHYPWTLDPVDPDAGAVRTAPDHLNNVEQVFVENPLPGAWLVEVHGFSVPQGPQSYSLCTSGSITPCTSKGIATLNADSYRCSSTAELRVVDCDLNIDESSVDTASASITSLSDPIGVSIVLTETGTDTNEFEGSVFLDAGGGVDTLLVSPGDTITATYIDADDGAGGLSVPVTAPASIDCTGPVHTNVQVTEVDLDRAVVTFGTNEFATATVRVGLACQALLESVSEPTARVSHEVPMNGLQSGSQYFFSIESVDLAGNTGIDDNQGACYSFYSRAAAYDIPLDADPGWSIEGDWAFGQPTGGGSHDGDPIAGHTGMNVYGTNLNGNYAAGVVQTYYLTTTPFDLSQQTGTELRFWRWLLVEPGAQDFVSVEVSNDGVNWVTVWDNLNKVVFQAFWVPQRFDISGVADGQPQVQVRWGLGPTSPIISLPGWNIDDIQIVVDGAPAESTCNDGILNQGETRIDCGGPCPPCDCIDDGACDDNLFCNGADWCNAFGQCATGAPVDCSDGINCTVDVCDDINDACTHQPDSILCDDAMACNGIETCDAITGCRPGVFVDCNGNGESDECDIESCAGDPSCADCNGNGVPDECDIGSISVDDNVNGIPDECDAEPLLPAPPPHDRRKNRYLSFVPDNGSTPVAIRVTLLNSLSHPDAVGSKMWLGIPDASGIADASLPFPLTRVWPEPVIHVTGCFISPVADYAIQASLDDGASFSAPLFVETIERPGVIKWWGDVVGSFDGTEWSPPQGLTNFDDALAATKSWSGEPGAPHTSVTDVEPHVTNHLVNINDVFAIVQAFQGAPYPFGCMDDPCFDRSTMPCP